MFLKDRNNGHMIEVLSLQDLFNLYQQQIIGRDQVGEEAQEPESYKKSELLFLSGEELPRCWVDPNYRHLPQTKPMSRALHS
ncbi:MAG: acetyltransferase [Pseudomonadales bacterium]|nr:acetyltransferase [Pseudomonadales bacterium]